MHHTHGNTLRLEVDAQQLRSHVECSLAAMSTVVAAMSMLVPQCDAAALPTHENDPAPLFQQALLHKGIHEEERANGRGFVHQELLLVVERVELFLCKVACAEDEEVDLRRIVLHGNETSCIFVGDVDVGDPVDAAIIMGGCMARCCINSFVLGDVLPRESFAKATVATDDENVVCEICERVLRVVRGRFAISVTLQAAWPPLGHRGEGGALNVFPGSRCLTYETSFFGCVECW